MKLPIYMMHEDGIRKIYIDAVKEALWEIINLEQEIKKDKSAFDENNVRNFGIYRLNDYCRYEDKSRQVLIYEEYKSIDWYILKAAMASATYSQDEYSLLAEQFLYDLKRKPSRRKYPCYDIVILASDVYSMKKDYMFGISNQDAGVIVSSFNVEYSDIRKDSDKKEVFKTIVMHLLGRMLGLIPESRKNDENVVDISGLHCLNKNCIMNFSKNLKDVVAITNNRLKNNIILCDDCKIDLYWTNNDKTKQVIHSMFKKENERC